MQGLTRAALVFAIAFTLMACNTNRASDASSAAAESFTRQYTKQKLEASVAGSDCHILLISIDTAFDRHLVESIHYGTSGYEAFGGVEQLARNRGFRAVVYRDAEDGLWTYGATTRDEAQAMPRCR